MGLLLDNVRLFDGCECRLNAAILIEGGFVKVVGTAGAPSTDTEERLDLQGRRLVPGFVDIQVNGGGGVLFNANPTVAGLKVIADAHVAYGTTSLLPTLISDDFEVIRAGFHAVREAINASIPGIAGIHIEGPFLSPKRRGAHDESKFRRIDDEAVDLLTSLGGDAVTLVTLAPEVNDPGRVRELVQAGVIVFAGHTAATYDDCVRAEQEGLSGYTHLFNAMTPLEGREPGVVGAALSGESTYFGIIADGHHVHPRSFKAAIRAKRPGGAVLVTDAMPTVGSELPWFELYGERIEVSNGALRNAAGSLAGSHLNMIEAVRNAMAFGDLEWTEAVRMASHYPAAAIGRCGALGQIRPGLSADLVELSDDMDILRVWRRGQLAFSII